MRSGVRILWRVLPLGRPRRPFQLCQLVQLSRPGVRFLRRILPLAQPGCQLLPGHREQGRVDGIRHRPGQGSELGKAKTGDSRGSCKNRT